MGHEGTHPGTALAVLLEWLDRGQHELSIGLASHGAEASVAQVGFRNRLAVQFRQLRLVIEQVHMGRRAVHEEVNDAFRLGRKIGKRNHRLCRQSILGHEIM